MWTEDDANSVYCPVRVLAAGVVLTFIGLSIYSVIHQPNHIFDYQSFGIGAGAVLTAAGAAVGIKQRLGA